MRPQVLLLGGLGQFLPRQIRLIEVHGAISVLLSGGLLIAGTIIHAEKHEAVRENQHYRHEAVTHQTRGVQHVHHAADKPDDHEQQDVLPHRAGHLSRNAQPRRRRHLAARSFLRKRLTLTTRKYDMAHSTTLTPRLKFCPYSWRES